jgi:hypothetical protein
MAHWPWEIPPNPEIMSFTSVNEAIGRYRWTICGLVFAATTINCLDRQVLGLLKQTLSDDGAFGTDKASQALNYSRVVMSFQFACAIGMLLAGRIIDAVGAKKRLCLFAHRLEFGSHGSCLRPPHLELRFLARRAWHHRGRQFSGRQQNHRRVISQKGARLRNRSIQLRRERRRHPGPLHEIGQDRGWLWHPVHGLWLRLPDGMDHHAPASAEVPQDCNVTGQTSGCRHAHAELTPKFE